MAETGGTHIIKWDEGWGGINDILIYKHPVEDFKTHSVLIVNPSQVAIVYDTQTRKPHVFREGRHEKALEQLNQNHILRMGIGDKILYKENTSYHIDVYFVNLVRLTQMTFGTPEPIKDLFDPTENVNFELKAAGQYEAQIVDPTKLKELLSGTQQLFTRKDLRMTVRAQVIQKMRTALAKLFRGSRQTGFTVYDMNAFTDDVAKAVEVELAPYFEEYGLEIKHFMFENLEACGENLEKMRSLRAKKAEWDAFGREQAQIDVMKTAAGNEGNVGGFMGAGIGLGMGAGMAGAFGAGMANMAGQAFAPQGQMPPQQGYYQQPQGYYPPQGQMPPQGYYPPQGQMPPQQGYYQQPQGQMPPQGYYQQPQGQMPPQGYYQQPQGQMPPQGYYQQPQGQMPPQGAPAPEAAPAPAPAAAVCPNCGQPIQAGATVCGNCGQQLQ